MQYLYSNRINTLQLFSIVHQSKEYNVSGEQRDNVYAHSWLMVHYLFDANRLKEANAYFELFRKNALVDEAIRVIRKGQYSHSRKRSSSVLETSTLTMAQYLVANQQYDEAEPTLKSLNNSTTAAC